MALPAMDRWFSYGGVGQNTKLYSTAIPDLLFFAFQLKFSTITLGLFVGAFAERINFKAMLIFIVLLTTFIYSPVANWVWGIDGWLHLMGVVDFADALVLGKRIGVDKKWETKPNSIPMVILGAALL